MLKITINPFTCQVLISNKTEQVEIFYNQIDEWVCFNINNKTYDLHILYDSGLLISIYEVINNKIDYSKPIKNKVKVIY
jgi:hypothetical protein